MKALCANGAVINTAVVIATADGIIWNHDSSLLAENSGPIAITKHWASLIMTQMNYVKGVATLRQKSLLLILTSSRNSSSLIFKQSVSLKKFQMN